MHDHSVVGESVGDVSILPATQILQGLRQIPVIKAQPRGDARAKYRVDQAIVKVQAGLVDLSFALRKYARPGRGKPVGRNAETLHERDVLRVAMVVVAGHITGVSVYHFAGSVTEGVPNAGSAAVLRNGALDLIARGGRAPNEPFGKLLGHLVRCICLSVTVTPSWSAFHRAASQASHDMLLGQQEEDYRGQDGYGDKCQDQRPVGAVLPLEPHDAQRPSIGVLAV